MFQSSQNQPLTNSTSLQVVRDSLETDQSDRGEAAATNQNDQCVLRRGRRYTPQQVQAMENVFKECQHPDETGRLRLSEELGLKPIQVKFWFQNRRTRRKSHKLRAIASTSIAREAVREPKPLPQFGSSVDRGIGGLEMWSPGSSHIMGPRRGCQVNSTPGALPRFEEPYEQMYLRKKF